MIITRSKYILIYSSQLFLSDINHFLIILFQNILINLNYNITFYSIFQIPIHMKEFNEMEYSPNPILNYEIKTNT
jgi:hypothetical protein